ncbi:flagellar transcriptional regulator FlhD [Ramlibacter sp.]|uniref:flagellar transcriptional regulator FlhD n=1 Tax=Ramlibacter sp. TaxID=1917967 RepID=UPI002CAB6586|nr:flagellar transcriptional regulator FlhD [Ramlibacter sp.]HWI83349.1 flagellar transcriptional regulator FlhD [Ramlibacter sp.]
MKTFDGTNEASQEIADLNLTYMLLAQKLLRQDRVGAMLRLGISTELADLLIGMSLAQIIKLATSNFVLCAFRLDDLPVAQVVQGTRQAALTQAHLSIVLAGSHTQAALAAA